MSIPLEIALLIPLVLPFVIGLLVGVIVKRGLKLLIAIVVLVIVLVATGYLNLTFQDTLSEALTAPALTRVMDIVFRLDVDSRPREITAAFIANPGWLEKEI